ncbi:MAG: recombination-associated protein RdgC [Planctomycetes bacterium]|nr:recombination-associated protein RdgC [Planctomycetota bacterium]
MAAAIRKSGGIVAFHWQGKLQDPATQGFAEALAQRRFRTIENAASEEISVGWVTKADPTGDTFALEDLDGGAGTWLRVRLDKKTLPKKWLQIHRDAAEKSRGKKLSARERRELKDDLTEKLLPRVLPAVNLVDALLFFDRRLILLFATSRSVVEAFGKLFFETFSLPLERQNPRLAGLQLKLGAEAERSLDRLEPVRWPRGEDGDGRPRSVPKPVRATALDDEEDGDEAVGDDADRRRNKTADGDDTPPWQEQDA